MKIRHVLAPEGYQALYILPQHPFLLELPLSDRALVKRNAEENVADDELIGFVAYGTRFVPADSVPNFVAYVHPEDEDYIKKKATFAMFAEQQSRNGEWIVGGDEPQYPSLDETEEGIY